MRAAQARLQARGAGTKARELLLALAKLHEMEALAADRREADSGIPSIHMVEWQLITDDQSNIPRAMRCWGKIGLPVKIFGPAPRT
jgi:hypothetical protein